MGLAVCVQELTNRSLVGRTDPVITIDELRTLHMKYNCMFTDGITAEAATWFAIGAVRKNPLYRNFVEVNQEIDTMNFDDSESKSVKLSYKHVSQLLDEIQSVLAEVDKAEVLDKAFAIATDQYVCAFCKGPLVFHVVRECPSMASLMREATAYAKNIMNPDVQDKPTINLPRR